MTARQLHPSQRGAALLAAMLTVALVATLAAGAMWQQWRLTEVEGIERQRAQAHWLLNGAMDWARVILREDARAGSATGDIATDHLAEPWAVPLQEVRLSSFLSALPQSDVTLDDTPLADQVFLTGRINDLQARLNVANLLQGNEPDRASVTAFSRLFNVLGVPLQQLDALLQGLQAAQRKEAGAPLMPQRTYQLAWLGVSPQSLAALAPYITVLPTRTTVNVNTAPAEVLYAIVPSLSLSSAQALVQTRARSHWTQLDAFQKAANITATGNLSVETRHFEVIGQLRLRQVLVTERSVVQRDGGEVRTLWREFSPWSQLPFMAATASLQ